MNKDNEDRGYWEALLLSEGMPPEPKIRLLTTKSPSGGLVDPQTAEKMNSENLLRPPRDLAEELPWLLCLDRSIHFNEYVALSAYMDGYSASSGSMNEPCSIYYAFGPVYRHAFQNIKKRKHDEGLLKQVENQLT